MTNSTQCVVSILSGAAFIGPVLADTVPLCLQRSPILTSVDTGVKKAMRCEEQSTCLAGAQVHVGLIFFFQTGSLKVAVRAWGSGLTTL